MRDKHDAPPFNPWHRIVGVIVVVTLAVVLLPLILGENEPSAELQGIAETAKPGTGSGPQVVVMPVTALPAGPASGSSEGETVTAASLSVPVESAPPPAEKPAPKEPARETAKPAPKPAIAAAPAPVPARVTKGWVVQVGVYADAVNAARVRDKLKSLHLDPIEDRVAIASGKGVRLRVGPYRERAAAEQAQTKLKKGAGMDGVVRAYP